MAFLTLNGFTVSILDGSAELSEEEIGSSTRAFSGHIVQSTRARARVLSAQTPILSATDAKALVGLLKGEGHYFGFADEYSSRGAGPSGGTYTVSSGNLTVLSGNDVTFDTSSGAAWSIIAFYAGDAYTLDSTNTQYKNGTTTTGNEDMFEVPGGSLEVYGAAAGGVPTTMTWDWIAVAPYVLTAAMHATFSSVASFSELPVLAASGTVFGAGSTPVYMRLQYESLSLEPVQYMASGSITTGFEVSFTLEEVL